MEAVAFNQTTIYELIQKLPYCINNTVYDIPEEGKDKMSKVLLIIAQQRAKAQARATDATNNPATSSNVSSHLTTPPVIPLPGAQSLPATTDATSKAATTNATSSDTPAGRTSAR